MNRADLTADRFRPNPFAKTAGALLYKTGDLAHYTQESHVYFVGRIDHQVKVRGYRIELTEVEAALKEHPAIQDTVVATYDDEAGGKRLAAYFISAREPAPTTTELREYLRGLLPDYMAPSAFVMLEDMPLTPSGKVDRARLPEPGRARPDLARQYVPPRTPIEESVSGIFCQVLNIERIGVNDNFFELGGHSLLAIQVISRVRDILNVDLEVRVIFEAPTVAELAIAIVQGQAELVDSEDMPELLAEIEQLSEDEAAAMAADESQA
jgi:hypothetical protein